MTKSQLSPRDIEQLSAYLDGALRPRQRAALEKRLHTHYTLRKTYEEMHKTRLLLRSAPRLRAPHNFTLTPQLVRAPLQTRLPALFGTVSAFSSALLILFVIGSLLIGNIGAPASSPEALAVSINATVEVESEAAEEAFTQAVEADTKPADAGLLGAESPEETGRFSVTETSTALPELTDTPVPPSGSGISITGETELPSEPATPEVNPTLMPPTAEPPAPTATPAEISPIPTDIPTEAAPPTESTPPSELQAGPEGISAKSPGETTSPAPFGLKVALFTGEIILAGMALLTGITAFVLFLRSRR